MLPITTTEGLSDFKTVFNNLHVCFTFMMSLLCVIIVTISLYVLSVVSYKACAYLRTCVQLILLVQWDLRTRDTLGLIVLSLVERLSLSRR